MIGVRLVTILLFASPAVLEFIKEHPTASSIGIIVGAGVLLGPDLLAGTAVAGVFAGLAASLTAYISLYTQT